MKSGFRTLASIASVAVISTILPGTATHAGERAIFSNSSSSPSKINVPREEFRPENINPNAEGFDKEKSSVEGVMAPWQNPMNSRSSLKQRKMLLRALDRQKNWALQDPNEILESTDLTSEANLDDVELSDSSGFATRELSSFERYYARRETRQQYDFGDGSYDGSDDDLSTEQTDQFSDLKKDGPKDTFDTKDYYSSKFSSVFDQPNLTGAASRTNPDSTSDFVTGEQLTGNIEGFTDAFTDLGIQASTPSLEQTRSQEFDQILNTSIADLMANPAGNAGSGATGTGIAGMTSFGAGNRSPVADGFRQTMSEGLNQSSVLDSFSTPAMGGSQSTATSGGFFNDRRAATESIQNRPAVFQLPKRSF